MKKLTLWIKNIAAEKGKFIDYSGLFLIGIISLGFLLSYRSFAKLYINLFFIKIPFFIGDITFVICGYLFIQKWLISRKKANIFTFLFLFYCVFVVTKTIFGYINWGPLALRHAVLFCYPLFAIFSYSFYRNDFFEPKKTIFLILVFIFILKFFNYYLYFSLTLSIITLVLINAYPIRLIKYILYFLLLLVVPFKLLFYTSRTFMVGNLFAMLYLSLGFLYVSKIKIKYKQIFLLLFLALVFYGLAKKASPSELKSLLGYKELVKRYNEKMEYIRIRESTYVPRKLDAKLYNEESVRVTDIFSIQFKEARKSANVDSKKIKKKPVVKTGLSAVYDKKITTSLLFVNKGDSQPESSAIPGIENNAVSRLSANHDKEIAVVSIAVKEGDSQPESLAIPGIENNAVSRLSANYDKGKAVFWTALKKKDFQFELYNQYYLHKKVMEETNITTDLEQKKVYIPSSDREIGIAYSNSLFRILIWKDAFKELRIRRPIFGFDFGKPFRSRSLEIAGNAAGEWGRDGWICIHNSYIDIVYRAGILGVLMVAFILIFFCILAANYFQKRSLTGVLLTGILLNWLIAANFLEILEMPYSAIPLWSLFGLTSAYLFRNKTQ